MGERKAAVGACEASLCAQEAVLGRVQNFQKHHVALAEEAAAVADDEAAVASSDDDDSDDDSSSSSSSSGGCSSSIDDSNDTVINDKNFSMQELEDGSEQHEEEEDRSDDSTDQATDIGHMLPVHIVPDAHYPHAKTHVHLKLPGVDMSSVRIELAENFDGDQLLLNGRNAINHCREDYTFQIPPALCSDSAKIVERSPDKLVISFLNTKYVQQQRQRHFQQQRNQPRDAGCSAAAAKCGVRYATPAHKGRP